MKSTANKSNKQADDLSRRRFILGQHIGQDVQFKRSGLRDLFTTDLEGTDASFSH
jgi:hypothetical protein